jgi:phytoene synthase
VLRTNRLFRISQVFAPAGLARKLLPLHALFGAVEEICSEHSDTGVASRKLDWWRNEVSQLGNRGSNHPILCELLHSGAWEALRGDSLGQLFDDAEARLDPASPLGIEDLQGHCRDLSQPRFELELSLSGSSPEFPYSVRALTVTSGLAQLMREAKRRSTAAGYWWLPLSMMANHGVSRADVRPNVSSPAVRALLDELIDACCAWSPALEQMHESRQAQAPDSARHLVVMGQLQAQALGRMRSAQPGQFDTEMDRVGLAQLYQAWKAARQVSRL